MKIFICLFLLLPSFVSPGCKNYNLDIFNNINDKRELLSHIKKQIESFKKDSIIPETSKELHGKYYFSYQTTSYKKAIDYCYTFSHGSVLTIESEKEYDFIKKSFDNPEQIWIDIRPFKSDLEMNWRYPDNRIIPSKLRRRRVSIINQDLTIKSDLRDKCPTFVFKDRGFLFGSCNLDNVPVICQIRKSFNSTSSEIFHRHKQSLTKIFDAMTTVNQQEVDTLRLSMLANAETSEYCNSDQSSPSLWSTLSLNIIDILKDSDSLDMLIHYFLPYLNTLDGLSNLFEPNKFSLVLSQIFNGQTLFSQDLSNVCLCTTDHVANNFESSNDSLLLTDYLSFENKLGQVDKDLSLIKQRLTHISMYLASNSSSPPFNSVENIPISTSLDTFYNAVVSFFSSKSGEEAMNEEEEVVIEEVMEEEEEAALFDNNEQHEEEEESTSHKTNFQIAIPDSIMVTESDHDQVNFQESKIQLIYDADTSEISRVIFPVSKLASSNLNKFLESFHQYDVTQFTKLIQGFVISTFNAIRQSYKDDTAHFKSLIGESMQGFYSDQTFKDEVKTIAENICFKNQENKISISFSDNVINGESNSTSFSLLDNILKIIQDSSLSNELKESIQNVLAHMDKEFFGRIARAFTELKNNDWHIHMLSLSISLVAIVLSLVNSVNSLSKTCGEEACGKLSNKCPKCGNTDFITPEIYKSEAKSQKKNSKSITKNDSEAIDVIESTSIHSNKSKESDKVRERWFNAIKTLVIDCFTKMSKDKKNQNNQGNEENQSQNDPENVSNSMPDLDSYHSMSGSNHEIDMSGVLDYESGNEEQVVNYIRKKRKDLKPKTNKDKKKNTTKKQRAESEEPRFKRSNSRISCKSCESRSMASRASLNSRNSQASKTSKSSRKSILKVPKNSNPVMYTTAQPYYVNPNIRYLRPKSVQIPRAHIDF